MSDARALTVGLVWHSINSGNLGVGALTASHIAILEKVAGDLGTPVEFQVFGFQEEGKPYISGKNIRYQPLRVKDFLAPNGGLYAAIRRSDVVCDIGGGDSFTDIYGLRRFVFLSFSKLAVLLFGKPLILSPQTIGPFKHAVTRTIAERLMRRCYAVIARDDLSYAILKRIGGNARTFVATDVAFRLPYASAPKVKGDKVKVGVNVSALLSGAAQDGQNTFGLQLDYPMLMRAILRHFTARDDCEVHLVSHVVSPHAGSEDDFQAAQTLHEEFPETIVVPPFASPSHAKSYISKLISSVVRGCTPASPPSRVAYQSFPLPIVASSLASSVHSVIRSLPIVRKTATKRRSRKSSRDLMSVTSWGRAFAQVSSVPTPC